MLDNPRVKRQGFRGKVEEGLNFYVAASTPTDLDPPTREPFFGKTPYTSVKHKSQQNMPR